MGRQLAGQLARPLQQQVPDISSHSRVPEAGDDPWSSPEPDGEAPYGRILLATEGTEFDVGAERVAMAWLLAAICPC